MPEHQNALTIDGLKAYYVNELFRRAARGPRRRRHQPDRAQQRDLRHRRRILERQDLADQDACRRHPAADARRSTASVKFNFGGEADRRLCRAGQDEGGALAAPVLHHAGLDERAEPGAPGEARLPRFRLPPHGPRPATRSAQRVEAHLAAAAARSAMCSRPFRTSFRAACASALTIALATVCEPEFIIADEPTTALDVLVQQDVLALIKEVQARLQSSIIFVTHDMSVHAAITDRLGHHVCRAAGEEGPTAGDLRQSAASLHRPPDRQPAAHRRRLRRERACRASRRHSPIRRAAAASIRAARWPSTAAAREVPAMLPSATGGRVACFRAGEVAVA